jgi:hypothetical protein
MNEEIKLSVPQQITISRSYDRTINLSNHVKGHDYESTKVTTFISKQIPVEEDTPELRKEVSRELFEFCKNQTEATIQEEIDELKREAGQPVELYGKEYAEIADYISELYTVEDKDVLDDIIARIKGEKDKLSSKQRELLLGLVKKAKTRV